MSLPHISALGRGNLRAQLVRILDRLYPWPGMPALGNFQNVIAGFEHTARHIAGFLAGQPNDDRRNPARIAPPDLFLGTLSQSFRHPGLRAGRNGIDGYSVVPELGRADEAAMPAFAAP
jgi:hypothetical protein